MRILIYSGENTVFTKAYYQDRGQSPKANQKEGVTRDPYRGASPKGPGEP